MWAPGLQGDELAKQLAADDQAGKLPRELYNHYTIITKGKGGEAKYSQVAYASYFPQEIGGILAVFDKWLAGTGTPSCRLAEYMTMPTLWSCSKSLLMHRCCGHPRSMHMLTLWVPATARPPLKTQQPAQHEQHCSAAHGASIQQ